MGRNVTNLGLSKQEEKKELKKHAATIHCSNSLSLLQRKISNALLYHAYKELLLKEEHEISIKQLCKLIGYQGHNHGAIRDALRELISTVIEWNLIDERTGDENWTASSIIASVSLEGPLCYYAYSPRMKQLLHTPSMFGKIDLIVQSRFRSSYGLALYENCIRYRGLPYTKWFEMDLFKKLMGVPSGKYDVFRDFKRRVLDKAIDEVNMYSDLIIAVEFVREGRKVAKLRFNLKERAKKTRLGKSRSTKRLEKPSGLKHELSYTFGLTTGQIEDLYTAYDEKFIAEKLNLVKESLPYRKGQIKNLAAYLFAAIKNNYQPTKGNIKPLYAMNSDDQELRDLRKQGDEITQAYQAYREKVIQQTIAALPKDEHETFMQAFFMQNQASIQSIMKLQRRRYTKATVLKSPQVQAQLRQFALRELDFMSLMPLEEFVATLDVAQRTAWQKLKSCEPERAVMHPTNNELHCNETED